MSLQLSIPESILQAIRLATAQVERLRSTLIKTAARVSVSVRRVLVELAAFCPFAAEIRQIAQCLSEPNPLKLV